MLKEFLDKTAWDKIVATSQDGGLLQSVAWGNFQAAQGNEVFRLSNQDETVVAQVFKMKAGKQSIMYVPRGPIVVGGINADSIKNFFADLKKIAKEQNCFLLRFDPAWSEELAGHLPSGAYKAPRERQPVHTLIIDTLQSEEDLFKAMKSKWRYNIRLAEKKGVTTRWGQAKKDDQIFYDLVAKTTDRQDFGGYNKEYYGAIIDVLGPCDQASFLIAEYEGKPMAALLVAFFGDSMYYLHGASDYEYRKLMAPHLLQWEAIKEAKRRGLSYDFWGVAADPPANKQEEGWKGVTRFKKGFAPTTEITEYVGTYEIPINKFWYGAYFVRSLVS